MRGRPRQVLRRAGRPLPIDAAARTSLRAAGQGSAAGRRLVLRAQQVVDRLHGVEGGGRDLDEDGVPLRHRAVPQAGALERTELAATARLLADEPRLRIDAARQDDRTPPLVAPT